MMKRFTTVALVVGVACASGAALAQEAKPAEPAAAKLPMCPIMDEPVDFNVSLMTDDGPLYFCCKSCIGKYEKSPDKFAAKLKAQREALARMERVQVKCPVSGEAVDGKTSADIGGQKVAFCCQKCVAAFEKDPAAYKAKLEASYTYQTKCPVSGGKISATVHGDLPTGERIYYCCKNCEAKLLKDPAKYAPKLAEQGVFIDAKKIAGKSGK